MIEIFGKALKGSRGVRTRVAGTELREPDDVYLEFNRSTRSYSIRVSSERAGQLLLSEPWDVWPSNLAEISGEYGEVHFASYGVEYEVSRSPTQIRAIEIALIPLISEWRHPWTVAEFLREARGIVASEISGVLTNAGSPEYVNKILGQNAIPELSFRFARPEEVRTPLDGVILAVNEAQHIINAAEGVLQRRIRDDGRTRFARSIEFPPEYHQAGISILNYFGRILGQKYPGISAKVTIEQEGLAVRMIVETPDGMRAQVEETLHQYGLVVTGQADPSSLLTEPIQVLELRRKLGIAELELRQAREFMAFQEKHYEQRIGSLSGSSTKSRGGK